MIDRAALRSVVLAVVVGLTTGATVLGVGGRLVMALIAVLAGGYPRWSLGGTLEVVVLGGVVGGVGGLGFVGVRELVCTGWVVRGLVHGAVCFVVVVALRLPSVVRSAAAFDAHLLELACLFAGLFITYGVALAWVFERAVTRCRRDSARRLTTACT